MTTLEILALCLRYGEKVKIYYGPSDNKKVSEAVAYFAGYYTSGKEYIRNANDLLPVFKAVTKDGKMSNRFLNDLKAWPPSSIRAITKIEKEPINPDDVPAFLSLDRTIKKESRDCIVSLLTRYTKMHPGRPKLWFDGENLIGGTVYTKHDSYACSVYAISLVDGKLLYDVSTDMDNETGIENVEITDKIGLLDSVLKAIKGPNKPDPDVCPLEEEDFYEFIVPGALVRYNDNSDYRSYQELPGPIVEVVSVNDDEDLPTDFDTDVVIEIDGEKKSVKAWELEPIADNETSK